MLIKFIILKEIISERNDDTFKVLSTEKSLLEYQKYCNPIYKDRETPNKFKLEKVILIHRHGDRTPMTMYKSKWEEENCWHCRFNEKEKTVYDCKETQCADGDLTLKGLEQMKKLGMYIKRNYYELLDKEVDDIDIYVSLFSRTWSSAYGVINGIKPTETITNIKKAQDFSLYPYDNCPSRNNLIRLQTSSYFDSLRTNNQKLQPEKMADNYFTHICNDIKINCNLLECDSKKIKEYLSASNNTWQEQAELIEKNEKIVKIDFGLLSKKIMELFANKTKIHIFSAHDNTITSVLAGFGAGIYEKPPYASAIFIERLSKDNSIFYRLLYNGNQVKTILNSDDFCIKEKDFNQYLKLLSIKYEDFKELCTEQEEFY
ncbi:hypothetical protein H312_01826 [Anncaliia algerae PRA339]|uniref:Histidine acid phosphatase n=1 Tax=Anncaliia algerae PRA339 TaxID=1288291 RepID=A0A059F0D7_9MICR|nr:hypothetical protein H312_01826 [Anncaliia algerae PRA339]